MDRLFGSSMLDIRFGLLCLSLGLLACSQQVQHAISPGTSSPKASSSSTVKAEGSIFQTPSLANSQTVDFPESSPPSSEMDPSFSHKGARDNPILQHVRLDSRLFLSKDGSLISDFTVFNHNPIPISHLTVECAEYSPHQVLLKTSARVLHEPQVIGPQAQQFFCSS